MATAGEIPEALPISVYEKRSPFEMNQERLVTNALIESQAPADWIRANVGPPPRVLFPPRFGYPMGAVTIDECVGLERRYPDARNDFSGSTGAYGATSQPGMYGG